MEVIYESNLERCNVSSGREWKRGYCVFRKHLTTGSKVLEFYKDSHWQKAEPRAVCNLFSEYEVSHGVGSNRKRFVFDLKTLDQKYELGSATEDLRTRWIEELNKAKTPSLDLQNVIKTFNVVLLNEEYVRAHLNGFQGTCQLSVTDAEVVLVAGGQIKIRWKFSTIRRYKSQTGTFVLEVGRKAPTGEGEYRFDTVNPVELFDVLDLAVKNRIRAKGIEIGTTTPSTESSPKLPPSLPPALRNGVTSSGSSGRLNSPTTPIVDSTGGEYSHLNQINTTTTKTSAAGSGLTTESEYDMLFKNSERYRNQRRSEPAVLSAPPPSFLTNSRKLTGDAAVSGGSAGVDSQEEEAYEEMSAAAKKVVSPSPSSPPRMKHDKVSGKPPPSAAERKLPPRPLPPPRNKPPTTPTNGGTTGVGKSSLQKSYSTSTLEENVYDSPTSRSKLPHANARPQGIVASGDEYSALFDRPSMNASTSHTADENNYSHLNHTPQPLVPPTQPRPLNSSVALAASKASGDELYDIPKSAPRPTVPPQPTASVRKPAAKPQRPAPLPPPSAPGRKDPPSTPASPTKSNLSASAGSVNNNLIMQLKKRNMELKGLGKNNNEISDSSGGFYDCPTSIPTSPEGYNQVGDLIPGEYSKPVQADADGYVTVPETKPVMEDDDIYQVPK